MAITKTVSVAFKFALGNGEINLSTDTFKLALFDLDDPYNPDNGLYTDFTADEITATNGYTTGGTALTITSGWVDDTTNNKGTMTFDLYEITATGGALPDFNAAIVYDNTDIEKRIMGCIEFGETISIVENDVFQMENVGFEIL